MTVVYGIISAMIHMYWYILLGYDYSVAYNVFPHQREGLQGLFQEEDEHQVPLNTMGDTWWFC